MASRATRLNFGPLDADGWEVMWTRLAGFSHRLAWSIVFGLAGFFPCVMPFGDHEPYRTVLHAMCYVFDLPVAIVTRLDIPYVAGLDVYWFRGVGEFMPVAEMLWWHMRLAVPIYLLLLYIPRWVLRFFRAWRERSTQVAGI